MTAADILRELMAEEEEAAFAARRAMEFHLGQAKDPIRQTYIETHRALAAKYRAAYWTHRARVQALAGAVPSEAPIPEEFFEEEAAESAPAVIDRHALRRSLKVIVNSEKVA